MKKILLLIFFVSLSNLIYSQSTETQQINEGEDVIIMSKAKHEALRRDIDDYKNLLIKYQSLRIEYETLISDLDRQSKLLESKVDALEEGRKRIKYLDDEIETLRIIIQKQSKKITDAENSNRVLRKLYETESAKAYSMKKGQAEVYIWRYTTIFFFCMMLIVGTQGS